LDPAGTGVTGTNNLSVDRINVRVDPSDLFLAEDAVKVINGGDGSLAIRDADVHFAHSRSFRGPILHARL
jgi:hypothetical protein